MGKYRQDPKLKVFKKAKKKDPTQSISCCYSTRLLVARGHIVTSLLRIMLNTSSGTKWHRYFYWPDALPVTQTKVSKHWQPINGTINGIIRKVWYVRQKKQESIIPSDLRQTRESQDRYYQANSPSSLFSRRRAPLQQACRVNSLHLEHNKYGHNYNNNNKHHFYGHYTGHPALAGTSS